MTRRLPGQRPTPRASRPALAALALALALAGCATPPPKAPTPPPEKVRSSLQPEGLTPALAETAARVQTGASDTQERSKIFRGTGQMVKGQPLGGGLPDTGYARVDGGSMVTLNFEAADIRDVVRNVLGDILQVGYVIDPAVGGSVTIRTSSGIPRTALEPTLEMLLRMNGATMIKEGPVYKIVPQAAAVRGNVTPMLGNARGALPPGFSVQIVPLMYTSAREMVRLLEPIAKDAQAVRADDLRNLMILSGTERELSHLLDAIALFDVDWMKGMSAGLFPLQSADVKSVGQEIEKLLGQREQNPLGGLIRIVPIERMNALLVITPNPLLIDRVREWIDKLDQGTGGEGVRFYVYNLQNSRAERVGPLLQQAFTGRPAAQVAPQPPSLAPGTPAGQIVSPPTFQNQPSPPVAPPSTVVVNQQAPAPTAAQTAAQGLPGTQPQGVVRNIQVVADRDNNTLLIVATPAEWIVIESALKKLDVPARQVMIELVIAEVSLTDDFQFGVEWYFKNGSNQAGGNFRRGTVPGDIFGAIAGTAANVAGVGLGARVPGFNYLLSGMFPGGIQAAVSLLGTAGNTKIVANPHVAALDNQRSTIKVGDRIPITQQTLVGGTTNAVTTTSQYIDTGVLVSVTPRINAGGLVTMDIQAEVSNPGDVTNAGDAPPINTRSLQSMVAVQSGDTLIMGGLIRDTKQQSSEGIPWLTKIPILGGLFGQQEVKDQRSELVLFVTPRVVETAQDMRGIIEDLRRRMDRLDSTLIPPLRFPAEKLPQGTTVFPPLSTMGGTQPMGGPWYPNTVPGVDPAAPIPDSELTPERAKAEIQAARAAQEKAAADIAAARAAQERAAADSATARALSEKATADSAAAKAAQERAAAAAAASRPAPPPPGTAPAPAGAQGAAPPPAGGAQEGARRRARARQQGTSPASDTPDTQ